MKKLSFLIILFLFSCSEPQLSDKDINEIAIITCNVLSETRELNSALAIKELNEAREKIGQERFLGSSDTIKKSFDYDLCPSLVKNNDNEYKELYSQLAAYDYRKSRINRQSTKIRDSIKEIDKIFEYFKIKKDEDVPAGTKLAKISDSKILRLEVINNAIMLMVLSLIAFFLIYILRDQVYYVVFSSDFRFSSESCSKHWRNQLSFFSLLLLYGGIDLYCRRK